MPKMIIGITGTIGAGKGTVAAYLEEKGFKHLSVRDFLKEEIRKRRLPINRTTMKEVADSLRKANSPSYILEQLYLKAKGRYKDAVLESIRNSHEIEKLRELGDFILLAVDADRQIRFRRIRQRNAETDNIDFRTFIEHEEREMAGKKPYEMDIARCLKMADHTIINNGSLAELKAEVDRILKEERDEKD